MNNKHLIWIIPLTIMASITFTFWIDLFAENQLLGDYDLYQCIYNNADVNNFNQNPVMIQKIQDECICFRENNYTNLLEVNCSR
jgi:hypothetical protein